MHILRFYSVISRIGSFSCGILSGRQIIKLIINKNNKIQIINNLRHWSSKLKIFFKYWISDLIEISDARASLSGHPVYPWENLSGEIPGAKIPWLASESELKRRTEVRETFRNCKYWVRVTNPSPDCARARCTSRRFRSSSTTTSRKGEGGGEGRTCRRHAHVAAQRRRAVASEINSRGYSWACYNVCTETYSPSSTPASRRVPRPAAPRRRSSQPCPWKRTPTIKAV